MRNVTLSKHSLFLHRTIIAWVTNFKRWQTKKSPLESTEIRKITKQLLHLVNLLPQTKENALKHMLNLVILHGSRVRKKITTLLDLVLVSRREQWTNLVNSWRWFLRKLSKQILLPSKLGIKILSLQKISR